MYQFAGRFNRKTDLQDTAPHLGDKLLISGNIALGKELHSCACDEYEIFCFGTIYNLEDLKARFNIRTEHHCKAIHDLFILKGNHWSTLADGEFTVIMQNDEEFFIWRDRHGTGPQVYYNDEVFASHPFMLREFKDFSSEPDWESIATFMGLGYIPSPQTALKNVRKLPAGQSLHWRNGSISTHYLYSFEKFLEKTNTFKGSEDEATEIYKELHIKAIHSRTRQSKSVGLLLSGGYDSGGNIYALRQSYAGSAQSVSIGFKDNPWTEVPLARIMSDRFETHFTSYEITGSELEDLPLIVKQLGDPFQEGGLMVNYMAMKMATGFSADVILGGDGNDQHFGTSGKELALHWQLRTRGMSWLQRAISAAGRSGVFDSQSKLFRLRFHNNKVLHIIESDCFGFPLYQARKFLDIQGKFCQYTYASDFPAHFDNFDHFYFTRNYLIDIEQVVNEVILFKASRIADLFGNPLTFPYMSTELYDFLQTLPRHYKCRGSVGEIARGKGTAKFIHKNYLKPFLPKEITQRKKQGGFAPLPLFFRDPDQRRAIIEIIRNSGFYKSLRNRNPIEDFFREYETKSLNEHQWFWYRQLMAFRFFNLAVMAIWWEIHIEGKTGSKTTDFL